MPISAAKAKYLEEAQYRRHGQKIRNLKSEHNKEYRGEVKKNETQIGEIRDRYEGRIENMEIDLERRLAKMRNKHKEILKKEKMRLEQELETLQDSFAKKKEEWEISQLEEYERMQRSYQKILKNAENKALKERNRIDS